MAIPVTPFSVPNPGHDTYWQSKTGPINAALLALLSSTQLPVEIQGTWCSPDDPPVWQFQYAKNFNLAGINPFTAGQRSSQGPGHSSWQWTQPYNLILLGKYTPVSKPAFDRTYDDASNWQFGFHRNILALATPLAPHFGQFQDDSSFWQWAKPYDLILLGKYTPVGTTEFNRTSDDASTWQFTFTLNRSLLSTATPFFAAQRSSNFDDAPTWQWAKPYNLILTGKYTPVSVPEFNRTYDDPPTWQKVYPRNYALLSTFQTFIPHFDRTYDDAANWQWQKPYNLILTGKYTPVSTPEFNRTYDDASNWQWEQPYNLILTGKYTPASTPAFSRAYDEPGNWQWEQPYNLTLANSIAQKFLPVEIQGTWNSPDESSFWQGEPTPVNLGLFPPGGLFKITPHYNPGPDDPPPWQFSFIYNLTLIDSLIYRYPGCARDLEDDPSTWQWIYPRNTAAFSKLVQKPFTATFDRTYDDAAFWQWEKPYNLILTGKYTPVATPEFNRTYDDPSVWQWQKPYNVTLLGPSQFRPSIFAHFDRTYDDSSAWQWLYPRNISAFSTLIQRTFVPTFDRTYDDSPVWQWKQPYDLILLGKYTPVSIPEFTRTYDDPAFWSWKQPFNTPLLTINLPFRPAFDRTNDDASFWQWQKPYNLILTGKYTPVGSPKFDRTYDDAAFWQWKKPYNVALLGPSQFHPQIFTHFDRTYDDASFWQWKQPYNLVALNTIKVILYTIGAHFGVEYDYDDASGWQWIQPFPGVLYFPVTPIPPVRVPGPKVISVDTPFGSDLVLRFDNWNAPNPIYVGDVPSLIVGCGRTMGTGPFSIQFTKPDGSQYNAVPTAIYDNQLVPAWAAPGRFEPQTYVVYVFLPGEIDQIGVWKVVVGAGNFTAAAGSFTISPTPQLPPFH